jgi:hypothetical protein
MGTSAFVYKEVMQRTFMSGAVVFTPLPTPFGRPGGANYSYRETAH